MKPLLETFARRLPFGLSRHLVVPESRNAQRRQLLYGLTAVVFTPLLLLIGLISMFTSGWIHAVAWLVVGAVMLMTFPLILRGHSTGVMAVFLASCLLGTLYALVLEPQNPVLLGGLVVVVIATSATENLRVTLVVAAAATASAIGPVLVLDDHEQAALPVGSNLPSRTVLMLVVTTIGAAASYFNERMLAEARRRGERNEALAERLRASRDSLELQVAQRTAALAERNRELEKVNSALDSSIQRELQLAGDLRQLAETDDLTGLTNRRGFLTRLATALPAGGWLALADLDHFKRINDGFGHAVGDRVLRRVAEALAQGVPGYCDVARIGGEEFAILVPDRPGAVRGPREIQQLVDRIVAVVRELTWPGLASGLPPDWRVTTSVGAARFDLDPARDPRSPAEATSDLLGRADRALFAAKAAGRDQARLSRSGPFEA